VLEIVAVLQRHVPDDTYRFFPARDFTGRNVYRASLLRLENFELIHGDALRAGHLDGVIAFAKGRAFERLRAFELATQYYELAAERSEELRADALASAGLCAQLKQASEMTLFDVNLEPNPSTRSLEATTQNLLEQYDARVELLDALLDQLDEKSHYRFIVREEIERADWVRASYFLHTRMLRPKGNALAVAEYQRLLERHHESKNFNRQLLELASLYANMAREYVQDYPPEGLLFDPVQFRELVDATTRTYQVVTSQDGTPERIEATRELEAFLAFTLRIEVDRFTD